jgi:hypothetical protein
MFEFLRPEDASEEDLKRRFDSTVNALLGQAKDAFGLRLVVRNDVLNELRYTDANEPSQVQPGWPLPQPTRLAYLEFYFDHQQWGDEFFARPAVLDLVTDPAFGPPHGYHIEEKCGFDKR